MKFIGLRKEKRKIKYINITLKNLMEPVKMRQRQTVLGDTWQKDKRLQVKF